MYFLVQLGWFGGWVLGIIGFFIARSALSELRQLRGTLAQQAAHHPVSAGTDFLPHTPSDPVPFQAAASGAENPPPEPAVRPYEEATAPPRDLEALLTTRLGVWVGSAALLLAGIFLVRYAVEQARLGPAARCVAAALLGLILLIAAEWLHRHEGPPLAGPWRIDQAPSALAAGGTAILFGAAYGAGPLYALLPPLLAFAAMAAASLTGLAAALRYGPLTAATGIVGGFVTPALVATQTPSLPGLFAYLFVVSAAALLVVRRTAWTWLGWATTIAGAVWVCFAAIPAAPDRWAASAFVAAAAALNLFLLPAAALDHPVGRRLAWVPFATMGAAGLVLEACRAGRRASAGAFPAVADRRVEGRRRTEAGPPALGRRTVRPADVAVLGAAVLDAYRRGHSRRRNHPGDLAGRLGVPGYSPVDQRRRLVGGFPRCRGALV